MQIPAHNEANLNLGRRNFLRTASVAAAAGLTLTDARLFTAHAEGQGATSAPPAAQLFTAETLEGDIKALQAAPGNNNLVNGKNFTVVLTSETAKIAKEFEWHEGRDHLIQILEGTTVY